MSITAKRLTAEEFLETDCGYECCELVRGHVVPLEPIGHRHGCVVMHIGYLLRQFLDEFDSGYLAAATGVVTKRSPDTVRRADMVFHGYDRIPKGTEVLGYPEVAPNVVVEVHSPHDRWSRIYAKIAEYQDAGVECVVILVPEEESARLFYPQSPNVVLGPDDELTLPAPLDGFRVRVARFFE